MKGKRHKPEVIVAKLRQVDVLTSQYPTVADPCKQSTGKTHWSALITL